MTEFWDRLPGLPALPSLTRRVDIPVYVIHQAADPEAYFFVFDFEVFVDRSAAGAFVRPVLQIWAGRDDFDRRVFARAFRETFAKEFDQMRRSASQASGQGWLSWQPGLGFAGDLLASLVATLVLAVATGTGRALASLIPIPSWLKGKTPEMRIEHEVEALRGRVDQALEQIEIKLHPELYAHAYRGHAPGPFPGMSYDTWPLPDMVRQHLDDGRSRSWW